MKKIAIILSALLISANSYAEQMPRGLKTDNRIKVVSYQDNNVFPIYGHFGYSTHVSLSPEEHILKVDIGDSDAWVVTPAENHLFVKNAVESDTNMSVVTDKRNYVFKLSTSNKPERLTYHLKFTYPEVEKRASELKTMQMQSLSQNLRSANPDDINWKYNFAPYDNRDLAPTKAFDDGRFTYFKFSDKKSMPAIFAVDNDGNESLVNYTVDGDYVVLHRTDKRYHLRLGERSVAVFNDNVRDA